MSPFPLSYRPSLRTPHLTLSTPWPAVVAHDPLAATRTPCVQQQEDTSDNGRRLAATGDKTVSRAQTPSRMLRSCQKSGMFDCMFNSRSQIGPLSLGKLNIWQLRKRYEPLVRGSVSFPQLPYTRVEMGQVRYSRLTTPILLTASREVFSPMQMDDEPDSEGPDVDSLAARLTRQVEMMMAQDSQGSAS